MSTTLEQALQGIYSVELERTTFADGSAVVEAWYSKMPGCIARSSDPDDAVDKALAKLSRLREPYLRKLVEDGVELPEPDQPAGYATETESTAEEGSPVWPGTWKLAGTIERSRELASRQVA